MSNADTERAEIMAALTTSMRQTMVETVLLFELLAQHIGINSTDMQCLNILDFEGSVPAGRLAELTGLTTGAITVSIDRLEKGGFVERVRDPRDRRRVIVQRLPPTQEGFEIFDTIYHLWIEHCAAYSDQELSIVLDFLNKTHPKNRDLIGQLEEKKGLLRRGSH
jgi:DNA-binding MarR family transcriptional regulator